MVKAITLRILDGSDRGRVFGDLSVPITIGREEGNTIQLNDERVSRYHVKIQVDNTKLVLTDLESTNGTKVNGEDIQLRILRFGDMITVGRSVLLYGTREQIARRLAKLRGEEIDDGDSAKFAPAEFGPNWEEEGGVPAALQTLQPPELPERLSPGQAAQLAELLEYFHIRLRQLAETASEAKNDRITFEQSQWQQVLDVQSRIAEYIKAVGEPPSDSSSQPNGEF